MAATATGVSDVIIASNIEALEQLLHLLNNVEGDSSWPHVWIALISMSLP